MAENEMAGAEGTEEQENEKFDMYDLGMNPDDATSLLEGMLSRESGQEGEGDEDTAEEEQPEDSEAEYEEEAEEEYDSDEDEVEDEEEYDEGGEEAPDSYTVKVDGEEVEVTLDELLSGYSFRRHNTQTAQELAAQRKELEESAETVRRDREQYGQGLTELQEALATLAPQEPDWDKLEAEDPTRFAVEAAKWNRYQQQLDAVAAEQAKVAQAELDDQIEQLKVLKAQEAEKLVKAIPEWKDQETAKKEAGRIMNYARSIHGFSDEELSRVFDSRVVIMMRKAMLYDEMSKKGKAAVRKKKAGSRAMKPGTAARGRKSPKAAKRKQQERSRARLAASGSKRDAERALLDLIGGGK
jgi:hypothetical protein